MAGQINRSLIGELAWLLGGAAVFNGLRSRSSHRPDTPQKSSSAPLAITDFFSTPSPLTIGLATAALGCAYLAKSSDSYAGQSVIITGGSRGLGLALARLLVEEGANVTLLARDPEELDRAADDLAKRSRRSRGGKEQIFTVVCDVTDQDHLNQAFAEARARFGQINFLIHNAGVVTVGPIETMDDSEFTAQMDLHFRTAVQGLRLIRPYFKLAGGGRIVYVSSIGGKIPIPHMAAYCASKFALAGFSGVARAELAHEGISVTSAYPGLMRTGSPIQAVFKGDSEREFAWFATGDLLPGVSMPAERAARRILEAARDRRAEVVVGLPAKAASLFQSLMPELFSFVNDCVSALMPRGKSLERRTGADSQGFFSQLAWTKPLRAISRRAEETHNQKEKSNANFNLGIHEPTRALNIDE